MCRAFYFTQVAYYGGAKYIATGRGFALTHTPFVKIYSSFGRSHIYFGFQLGMLAVMLAFLSIPKYFLSTWGTWFVSISLVFAPLWFNPQTFLQEQAWEDFKAWRSWLTGATDSATKESWCDAAGCAALLLLLFQLWCCVIAHRALPVQCVQAAEPRMLSPL